MADEFGNSGGLDEEEEVVKIDPATLAPDLWQAIKANDSAKTMELIEEGVPITHEDEESGWNCVNWAAYHGNGKTLKKLLELNGAATYHSFKKEQRESAKSEFIKDVALTKIVTSTPLMWAVFKGKQRCVWLLLLEGYSPDDADEKGNGCLHLAAGAGHIGILQALINDGANPFLLNTYKNSPLDVALNTKCREIIQTAMDKYSASNVAQMHADNVDYYNKKTAALNDIIALAAQNESPRAFRAASNIETKVTTLKSALVESIEIGLDEETIATAHSLEKKLDRTLELLSDLQEAQSASPIDTQSKYHKFITKLEVTIGRAEASGVDRSNLQFGRDLVVRSQIEFLVFTALQRLKDVDCAQDADEQDMIRLKTFLQKGQALQGNPELLATADARLKRLEAELEMSRAILAVPEVKMPIDEPPDDYWTEDDTGKLTETEEFPLPPAETGEYIWEHSVSYTKLSASIDRLRGCTDGAEELGANENIISEAITRLAKVEKEIKLLDLKDQEDKRVAIEVATKAAKKLKKGKKGGKKK